MKKTFLLLSVMAMALVLVFALVSCEGISVSISPDSIDITNGNDASDVFEEKFDLEDEIEDVFDEIEDYESGTAGSSLKICKAAFEVIDFAQMLSDEQIEMLDLYIPEFADEYTLEEKMLINETLDEIDSDIAKTLFEKGLSALEDRLSDAGNPQKYFENEYDEEKYQKVMTFLKKCVKTEIE